MNENFSSLEAIGEEFKKADDIENESLFVKGHIVKRAVEQGFNIDETVGYCAGLILRDKRTVYRYYSTARTFPQRLYGLPYEHHAQCADTIDYRKDMTPDELLEAQENALGWLKIASKESLSTRALRAVIKAAGGRVDVKPIVLLDGVECIIGSIGRDSMELIDVYLPDDMPIGATVKITLVLAPTEEKETT